MTSNLNSDFSCILKWSKVLKVSVSAELNLSASGLFLEKNTIAPSVQNLWQGKGWLMLLSRCLEPNYFKEVTDTPS